MGIFIGLMLVLLSPAVMADSCGVDVHLLDVNDDVIEGRIRNTGKYTENIEYRFYVDGIQILVVSSQITLLLY